MQKKKKKKKMIFSCYIGSFSLGGKLEGLVRIFFLSYFTFHLLWSTQRISKIFSAYTKTYAFYRAISFGKWNVNSGLEKQEKLFYINLFRGGGERNLII